MMSPPLLSAETLPAGPFRSWRRRWSVLGRRAPGLAAACLIAASLCNCGPAQRASCRQAAIGAPADDRSGGNDAPQACPRRD